VLSYLSNLPDHFLEIRVETRGRLFSARSWSLSPPPRTHWERASQFPRRLRSGKASSRSDLTCACAS